VIGRSQKYHFVVHVSGRYQKDVLMTLDQLLSEQQYLDGDGSNFGVADVAVGSMLLYSGGFLPAEVTTLPSFPHIVAYVDNLMTRPASSNLEMLKQGWREKVKGAAAAAAAGGGGAAGVTSATGDTSAADVMAAGGQDGSDQGAAGAGADGGAGGGAASKGGGAVASGADDVVAAGGDAKKQRIE
jgi:hypothetical protein